MGAISINEDFHKRQAKNGLKYLLYLPSGYTKDKEKEWPLILFLHGAGEKGYDLNIVRRHGPPKIAENNKDFPFIVVAPQCPPGMYWSAETLKNLLEEVMGEFKADKNRLYLTGISMGGFGTWEMAITYPDLFSAILPICGGGNPTLVHRIKSLPTWCFHGALDDIVPLSESEEMVEALRKVGGNVKFTVYPEADHDSWTQTYNNYEVFQWFLEFSKK